MEVRALMRVGVAAVALLLVAPTLTWAQDEAPAAAVEEAAAPEGPSLAERIGLRTPGDDAATVQQSVTRSYGPRFHDGASFINIDLSAEDIAAGLVIIEDTVRVLADGVRLLPSDYAVGTRPGSGTYVIRLLRSVPANTVIEVTYQCRQGVDAPAAAFSSALMGGLGTPQPIKVSGGENPTGALKLYYAKEGDIVTRDIGRRSYGGGDWFQLTDALAASTQVRDSVRQEYGFSIMDLQLGQARLSYGTVSNVDATSEGSYRDEFIRQNILGSGLTAGQRQGDGGYAAPEGSSRDVTWYDWRYGTPGESKVWYGQTFFHMDPNYGHVDSAVQQDIATFLQDPNRWGGRNLMSAWWQSGGTYAKTWQAMEGSGDRGRQDISQFAGEELRLRSWGLRPSENIMYSRSEFNRYLLESRRDATEINQTLRLATSSGGTIFEMTDESLAISRPSNASDVNATEQTILSDPGEDFVQRHTMRSLTQRLTGGDNPAQLRVVEDRFEELDRLKGIEAPTRRTTTASLSNVNLLGMTVGYTGTRNEYEDAELTRWLTGSDSQAASERHSVSFSGLKIAGPLQLTGSFSAGLVDGSGLQDSTFSLAVPTFEIFKGLNLAGATYTRQRDPLGASRAQRAVALSGNLLGVDWNATADWNDMTSGFSLGGAVNPYDRDYSTHNRAVNLNRTVSRLGTQLYAGYQENFVDSESLGELYRVAFAQPVDLGSLGNLAIQGSQYRHIDRFGVMRPSYGWAATWTGPEDKWTAAVRGFHHYGAGDELSFVSRSVMLAAKLGDARLSATWRDNPIWDPDGPDKPAGAQLQMGSMAEYRMDVPVNDRLNVSAAFYRNAALGGGVLESQTWNTVPLYGPSGSAVPTTWGAGNQNWATQYGIVYNFGEGKTVSLARNNTRYSASGITTTGYDINLQWALGPTDSLSFRYYNWSADSPRWGETVTSDPGGGPIGEAYTFRYSHKWSEAKQLSLGVTKTGPLRDQYIPGAGGQNVWGQLYADFMSDVPADTMVFIEYKTPF